MEGKNMVMLMISLMILMIIGEIRGSEDQYYHLGYFDSPLAAFINFGNYKNEKALYVTSFGFAPGAIDFVPQIASKIGNISSIKPERIIDNIVWPNEVIDVPEEIFGPNYIASFGGFIPPPSSTGEILIIEVETKISYKLTVDERGYFYHLGEFYDVDGDGLLDIISAKTNYPLFGGPGNGKLVWFKNPGTKTFPWKESLLFNGPDVFFRFHDFDGDGRPEVVASIFVNKRLSVFYNTGKFSNTEDWKEVVIDTKMGSPFDVRLYDLNHDGKLDLLATNHQNKIEESAVFAYEVPADFTDPNGYVRHVIAMGFETTQPGDGQASPGTAQAFYPVLGRTNEKPLIVVSGDGTQKAHLLRSVSENPSSWEYKMETMIFVNNTVGGIAVDDVDEDGFADIFVPNFDGGEIHLFTFAPPKKN